MKRDARWIGLGVVLALLAVNGLVLHKEWILRTGRPVLLALAPVDPRSLIQGDYMRLEYQVARDAEPARQTEGTLLLRVDADGVGHFVAKDTPPSSADQVLLRYRRGPRNAMQVGAGAFFFQEGLADAYADAKYGEFRVAANGRAVLVGLRD
jgi:uncharacterized membrane-anchored protein